MNPILSDSTLPCFDVIRAEHVKPAMEERVREAHAVLDAIEEDPPRGYQGLITDMDRASERVSLPWGCIGHLMAVRNSSELREAYDQTQPQVVELSMRFGQCRTVYDGLRALRDGEEWQELSVTQQRVVTLALRDAKLAGVALQGEERERFNAIALELSKLQTDFSNHVLDATKMYRRELRDAADVAGLPRSLLGLLAASAREAGQERATPESGPWVLTLAYPSFVGFMKHSANRALREELHRAYVTRASSGNIDNTALLDRILSLRNEKARLLGYDTFAEMSLASKMAPGVDAVDGLLEELRVASIDAARRDVDALIDLAGEQGAPEAADFRPWDAMFWSERLREQRFDYREEELRRYFPMPRVLEGVFALAKDLFGVTIRERAQRPPVWHDDVRYFDVLDGSESVIAGFYFDAFARPAEKRGGAWMSDVLGRSRDLAPADSDVRNPVAHMVCNGTPPEGGETATMTFSEVETLFHEFGHALQHMLTQVDEIQAAGINNIEWDAVELPSQFMENWVYTRSVMRDMTRHVDTGESLPDEMFEKLKAARTFQAGYAMVRQLGFAMTDIELHHRYRPGGNESPFEVHRRVSRSTTVIEPIAENRFLNSFGHIFAGGYAAGYFSYKWAEVLSADAFAAFEEAGLDDDEARRQCGSRFRDTVLGSGGSRPAMEIYEEFRGRPPSTEALLRHSGLKAA